MDFEVSIFNCQVRITILNYTVVFPPTISKWNSKFCITVQEREVIQNFQTYNVSYDLASFIECYIGHCLGSNGVKPDPAIIEDLFDSFEMIDGFSSASGILETLKLDKLKVCPYL